MQDLPKATTLLAAVGQFIDEKVMPEMDGRNAFHARVARNVLAIVEREIRYGAAFSATQRQRLLDILTRKGDGILADQPPTQAAASTDTTSQTDSEPMPSIETLNRVLCDRLHSGAIAYDDALIRDHLKKTIMGKLAIDQPKYASYRHARSLGWPEEEGYAREDD